MKLSVIIPVYNVRNYLDECLRSVVEQHVDDLEVILVDDGSTDGSSDVCDQWASRYPFITVIHQKNAGLSGARNAGLGHATGDFITFLDSDDRLGVNTWRDNLRFFDIYPGIDMVEFPIREYEGSPRERLLTFDPKYVNAPSTEGKARTADKVGKPTSPVYIDWLLSKGYEHCYACNKIYRATLWTSRRFPVGQVFEDTAVMPHIVRDCRGIFYSSKGCYHYISHKGSISQRWHYADCRQLFLNCHRLFSEARTLPGVRWHLQPLRKARLNRLIDMGRCRDCNTTDYHAQCGKVSAAERLICRLRLLTAPKL